MTARCDLSDLPVDQCACRIHAPAPPPRPPADVVARFPAQFISKCDYCGELIDDGERIAFTTDGDYVHDRCAP